MGQRLLLRRTVVVVVLKEITSALMSFLVTEKDNGRFNPGNETIRKLVEKLDKAIQSWDEDLISKYTEV